MANQNKVLLSEGFREYLVENYIMGDKSIPEIAKEYNTYANKIYRVMRKLGIKRKDKSEAQRLVLKTGKSKHPTAGKLHSRTTKRKIGRSIYNKNKTLPAEEIQRRIDKKRDFWYTIPEDKRREYTKRAHNAMRMSGKKGSNFERHIVAALLSKGYQIQTHYKLTFAESQMTVDILLPIQGICIEIDGPVHFSPIFGQKDLEHRIERDLWKNKQLMAEGFSLIRILNPRGTTSMSFVEEFIAKFIPFLAQVENAPDNSFHEIDVDDKEFKLNMKQFRNNS